MIFLWNNDEDSSEDYSNCDWRNSSSGPGALRIANLTTMKLE